MYDFAVIGKGLIGSAAFKHLTNESANTVLIGPEEPDDPTVHTGVFGAHHDQARLTHQHGKSPIWSELGRRSFATYETIEARSGMTVLTPVGELFVADPGADNSYHQQSNIDHSRRVLGLDLIELDPASLSTRFPYLSFPPEAALLLEQSPAGHINPRSLIDAQVKIARQAGGERMIETATRCQPGESGVRVSLSSGQAVEASRVLVAAGAFSNSFDLLPSPLDLTLKTETVVFARVSEETARRLSDMPVIHYDLVSDTLANIYAIGPVLYPDGNYYLKLGANTVNDSFPTEASEMTAWYSSGDSDANLDDLRSALSSMLSGVEVLGWTTGRCVITRTPKAFPVIDSLVTDRLFVAVGGNGSSAYCSDALGALAASLVSEGTWIDDLDHRHFSM